MTMRSAPAICRNACAVEFEDVREVVAAGQCPLLKGVAFGDLVAKRQRVIHVDAGRRKNRRVLGENRPNPLADVHRCIGVALLACQQMQQPQAAGEEACPLEIGPAVPDVVVIPAVLAGHQVETRHAAIFRSALLQLIAERVRAQAQIADGAFEGSLVVLVERQCRLRGRRQWLGRAGERLRRSPHPSR